MGSEKAKIVVVGDSGVGKTSLVHLICHGIPLLKPNWTIGCTPEVKIHNYRAGTALEKTYYIELWDVGGWSAHVDARSVFYHQVNGIVLVHDLTNRKSQQNLKKWLHEVVEKSQLLSSSSLITVTTSDDSHNNGNYDFTKSDIPVLIVGTKQDLTDSGENAFCTSLNLVCDSIVDEINLECITTKYLAPGTTHSVKLDKFFDKIIERKLHSYDGFEREKSRFSSYSKSSYLHVD